MKKYSQMLARIFLAQIFLLSGIFKITGYEGTQSYMEAMGVPSMLLPLVILIEISGGLAIAIGWQTRWAAIALASFTVLAGIIFHSNFSDHMQMILFMKNVAITGGLLLLVAHGAGEYSLDGRKTSG